jgi:hypothetical protein
MSATAKTNTVGYYNGNKWPIHLVISELNVTLHLKTGEYILDTKGRKINDSFFDKYTRPLQLSKELSKNGEVDLIAVPRVTSTSQATGHQHSVRAVTKFTEDAKGQRVPVMPAPVVTKVNNVNTPTHQGMSVEEARKRGLIGKAREIPEDYGITDTSGRPVDVSQAPPIKYAMESTPRIRQAENLPVELTQIDDKIDPAQAAARAQLVTGLNKSATLNVESATGFMNESTAHAPGQNVVPATSPQPQIEAPAVEAEVIDEALPQPNIFAPGQVAVATPAPVPDPLATARANAKKPLPTKQAAPKNAKPFVCNEDGQSFQYRSQLEKYAKAKHPTKVDSILAPYPAA